jgi:hypothetical protein
VNVDVGMLLNNILMTGLVYLLAWRIAKRVTRRPPDDGR